MGIRIRIRARKRVTGGHEWYCSVSSARVILIDVNSARVFSPQSPSFNGELSFLFLLPLHGSSHFMLILIPICTRPPHPSKGTKCHHPPPTTIAVAVLAVVVLAVASDPDPAMPLQPRTPKTGSVLSPLGSDSNSSYLLRPEIGAEKIRQREPIRQVKIRAPALPPLDLPILYGRSYSQSTSLQQQQQPPPSTPTRIRRPATVPYLLQSQQSLSHPTSLTPITLPTPTTTPYVDWTTRSFMPPDSSPLGPLTLQPSPYSIPKPSTQLLPYSTPHYPPERSSHTATPTRVRGAPPSILEDPEKLEKALRDVSRPAYLMLRCVLVPSVPPNP